MLSLVMLLFQMRVVMRKIRTTYNRQWWGNNNITQHYLPFLISDAFSASSLWWWYGTFNTLQLVTSHLITTSTLFFPSKEITWHQRWYILRLLSLQRSRYARSRRSTNKWDGVLRFDVILASLASLLFRPFYPFRQK
jgi:hypothetical protein